MLIEAIVCRLKIEQLILMLSLSILRHILIKPSIYHCYS